MTYTVWTQNSTPTAFGVELPKEDHIVLLDIPNRRMAEKLTEALAYIYNDHATWIEED